MKTRPDAAAHDRERHLAGGIVTRTGGIVTGSFINLQRALGAFPHYLDGLVIQRWTHVEDHHTKQGARGSCPTFEFESVLKSWQASTKLYPALPVTHTQNVRNLLDL